MYSIDDLVTNVLSKIQWNPTTAKTTILLLLIIIIIIIIMVYLTHPRGGFPVKIHYLQLKINKNALSSVESRLLGDIRAVYTRENKPRLTIAAAYIRREHPA